MLLCSSFGILHKSLRVVFGPKIKNLAKRVVSVGMFYLMSGRKSSSELSHEGRDEISLSKHTQISILSIANSENEIIFEHFYITKT